MVMMLYRERRMPCGHHGRSPAHKIGVARLRWRPHITKTASLLSRGGDSWRRCGCTFAEPLHDLLDDLARMRTDRNYDRMLTRAAIMFDRDIYTTTRRGPAEPAMISLFATHHPASRTTRVRG
jgi:hypothetical protein